MPDDGRNAARPTRKHVIVCVALVVGALHFVVGPDYAGPFRTFVNGYLIDILLPLSMYLLLSLPEPPARLPWFGRAALVLAVGVTVELLQLRGAHFLGRTFDPLDIIMYALGVLGGRVLELAVLSRLDSGGGTRTETTA